MTSLHGEQIQGQAVDASVGPAEAIPRTGLQIDAAVVQDGFRLEVNLTVAPGQILGVLGPNGAGKTTLLRALAGLVSVSQGFVNLDGRDLDNAETGTFVSAEERPVGLLFQNYRLFPHLSVRENVAFAPRCQGLGRGAARSIADEWLQRLGIAEFASRKPAQLSGGQAQRVALARALAANPGLLLLDEPLAALDVRTRLEVRTELRRHLRDFHGPALIVTHDALEAMVMTDRLLVLEGGRVVQQGTPAAVARNPASQYVARLVGLNLYAGVQDGRGKVILEEGGTFFVSDSQELLEGHRLEQRVLVALRPSAITLHSTRPHDFSPRNVWSGTVVGLELLTDRVRVEIAGSPDALVDVTPAAVAELGVMEGKPVWLSAKATDLDVYPGSD